MAVSVQLRSGAQLKSDICRFCCFMYFVYILFSKKCNRYYVGFSTDVTARVNRHNNGMVPATRNCSPYKLCAYKTFENEADARKEELRIKKQKSRIYTESLFTGDWPTYSNGLP